MTQTSKISAIFVGALVLAIATLSFLYATQAQASAPSGLPAGVASTTSETAGTTATTIVSTSTCSARIVTTYASPVMLTFSDTYTPTGTFGHLQPASTTVAYDSGQYGCGKVKVFGFVQTQITVTDN
jgi:hypothetical protein